MGRKLRQHPRHLGLAVRRGSSRPKPGHPTGKGISRILHDLAPRRAAIGCLQCEFRRRDELGVERQNIQHGAVITVGEAGGRVFDQYGVIAHVGRALDRGGDDVLDTLAADEQMADIGGAQNPVEIGAFETVGAEIDDNGLAADRAERVDDVDLPGADDTFILVLGALQQRVILVLRQFGKTGTPADIDEDGTP